LVGQQPDIILTDGTPATVAVQRETRTIPIVFATVADPVGVLMSRDENDPQAKSVLSAFTQALAGLGWTVGRNVQMDLRSAGGRNRTMTPFWPDRSGAARGRAIG
jgi:ABC-type uncharacterized transport system substrate-binding protein